MARPVSSHTACVLFARTPRRNSLRTALRDLGDWSYVAAAPGRFGWVQNGPALTQMTSDCVNVAVDVVDGPWPDDLGTGGCDPEAVAVLAGWRTGEFGLNTAPGALARAAAHTALLADAASIVAGHRAFVRIRASELGPDGFELLPYDDPDLAVQVLDLIARIGAALVSLPDALAWFAPCGEQLASAETMPAELAEDVPAALWVGVRTFHHVDGDRVLVDTVGGGQLGSTDFEAVFPESDEDVASVRAVVLEVVRNRLFDAPGGVVRGSHETAPLVGPMRPVVRITTDAASLASLSPDP